MPTKAWSRWVGERRPRCRQRCCRCCRAGPRSPRRPSSGGSRRRGVPVSPSPVAAKMIDWFGSLLRPKTAMPPMLMPKVGPKSVSGIVGRPVRVGRQEVGRLPDAAAGAADVDRVARGVRRVDGQAADAPGVAAAVDRRRADGRPGAAGQRVGRVHREDAEVAVVRSATGSPRPVPGTGFRKVSDQLLSVHAWLSEFVIRQL